MKPMVILRGDASHKIGYGHFVRTCALAGYLSSDFQCLIASRPPFDFGESSCYDSIESLPAFMRQQIVEAGAQFLPLQASSAEEYDRVFVETVEKLHPAITVLDNYYFGEDYQRKVKDTGAKLVCLDDMHERHFVADMVLSPSPVKREDFSLAPDTRFYAGPEYALLRPAFLGEVPARDRKEIRDILLAIGGADPLNLSSVLAAQLISTFPSSHIHIISSQVISLESAKRSHYTLRSKLSAKDMTNLMDSCDLAILPASTICLEAFARRLPVAAGWFADNQLPFYRHGVEHNWFIPLGDLRTPNLASALSPLTKPTFASILNTLQPPLLSDPENSPKTRIHSLFTSLLN